MSKRQKELFPELPSTKKYVSDYPQLASEWHSTKNGGSFSAVSVIENNPGSDLPEQITDEWLSAIEKQLGVFEIAEKCSDWISGKSSYVYGYVDITQYDKPIVYVGIGVGRRSRSHWTRSHNSTLNEYVDFWKSQNLTLDETLVYFHEGVTQRQAAALETLYIDKYNPECNQVRYWTPEGEQELSSERLLQWRVESQPVLAKDQEGRLRLFISAKSASKALGIQRNSILEKIGKKPITGTNQIPYSFRYLTDNEVSLNISKWPMYFDIQLNSERYQTNSLENLENQLGLQAGSIRHRGSEENEYTLKDGSAVRCKIIHNHDKEEITDFAVADNLAQPPQPKGYLYVPQRDRYLIQIRVRGTIMFLAKTAHEETAKTVAKYIYNNIDEKDVVKNAKTLLKRLKEESGERVRRFPPRHFSKPENILTQLSVIKPTSLSDWQKKHANSYDWAWRMGKQRELFELYIESRQ